MLASIQFADPFNTGRRCCWKGLHTKGWPLRLLGIRPADPGQKGTLGGRHR